MSGLLSASSPPPHPITPPNPYQPPLTARIYYSTTAGSTRTLGAFLLRYLLSLFQCPITLHPISTFHKDLYSSSTSTQTLNIVLISTTGQGSFCLDCKPLLPWVYDAGSQPLPAGQKWTVYAVGEPHRSHPVFHNAGIYRRENVLPRHERLSRGLILPKHPYLFPLLFF